MSRKMDRHADKIAQFKKLNEAIAQIGKEKRALESQRNELQNDLMKSMSNSTVGTINGIDAIAIVESSRQTATIGSVREHCTPAMAKKIINTHVTRKVKFL